MFRPAPQPTRGGIQPVLLMVAITLAGCASSATPAPPSDAPSSSVQGGTPAATASPAAAASPGVVASPVASGRPADLAPLLAHQFVRSGLPVQGLDLNSGAWVFDLTPSGFRLDLPEFETALDATAAAPQPGELDLTSVAGNGGCTVDDVGRYDWSLSPSGSTLTVTLISDRCATRAAALPGRWAGILCRDPNNKCLGDIDAGTYRPQYLAVPLAYTVPDGWANGYDNHDAYVLQRQADYAKESPGGNFTQDAIFVEPDPLPEDLDPRCTLVTNFRERAIGQLASWVASRPGIVATRPTALTLAGHPATMIDVQVKPGWTVRCPAAPYLPLVAVNQGDWGVAAKERTRLLFVDAGGGHTAMIAIDAPDGTGFAAFVGQATPIVQSFTFTP